MINVYIDRVKSFYANGKEYCYYDLSMGEDYAALSGLSREELIELYHSIARFFKEVEKDDLK